MTRLLSSAWVIARRDYGATVFSRVFLLFLATPLFSILFGGIFAVLNRGDDAPPPHPVVVLATDAGVTKALFDARVRLVQRLGDDALPDLVAHGAAGARQLLLAKDPGGRRYVGVLEGGLATPHLTLSSRAPDSVADDVGLLVDTARTEVALGGAAPPPVSLARAQMEAPHVVTGRDRAKLAQGAQTAVFFLLVLLSGMSLSTFIEEKSNKVIEVLAAAVPIDAIFLGKLLAMLAIALTGVAIWGGTAVAGVVLFYPQLLGHLAQPAVGWPVFCLLATVYFMGSYLLLGAVFLGLGSQANSPREVQSMAMPVTMLQLVLFGFVSGGVGHQDGWMALAAAVFPWSSPLAMLGRAAELPMLWPHALAMLWQLGWLVLALRISARLFRRAVLKSGGSGRRWWRRAARV